MTDYDFYLFGAIALAVRALYLTAKYYGAILEGIHAERDQEVFDYLTKNN